MTNMKIKLAAIAKDEAAYLPEWIFHHLYFGIDEIEIYVNFTTDNSYEVLGQIEKNFPIKFKNAEYLIDPLYSQYDFMITSQYLNHNLLQSRAYAEILCNAKKDGFSHVMFLDVDEFWTPACFSKNIKNILSEMGDPDLVSFGWKNRVGEITTFARPFDEEILCFNGRAFKSIIKTAGEIELKSSHISVFKDRNEYKKIKASDATNAFILHRLQRSEVEYLSLLGRGDPTFAGKFGLKFNRGGFFAPKRGYLIRFDADLINKYNDGYQNFLKINGISEYIEQAKKFVLDRSTTVMNYMQENVQVNNLIKKSVKGLTLKDNILSNSIQSFELNNIEVNILRDMALELEENDLSKAYLLMKIAHNFRPDGLIIERRVKQMARELKLTKKTEDAR